MTTALHDAIAAIRGAEWVTDAVLRLPLPSPTLPPATTTNHYLVGSKGAVLVDPATPHRKSLARLQAVCSAWQASVGPIVGVFLTHHHADHIAAATNMAAALDAPILAHAATAELLAGRTGRSIKVDRVIEEGDEVAAGRDGPWIARHTPGHAPGHLILHGPAGGMVAGDMVAGEGTILIDPRDGDMGAYLQSLRRMRSLGPSWLAPAHGPVLRDADATLHHYERHRLAREARVLAALDDVDQREDALLPHAYGDVPRAIWPLALRALRAHLHHLGAQGLAVESAAGLWRRTSR